MNILKLSFSYLKGKPLTSSLNVVLFGFGVAIILVLILFSKQTEERLEKNAAGIELVVGAKGSPLQLILCNIFHIDFPTGNISLLEAEKLANNRQIKEAIPLALGDSYKGIRMVGTTPRYPEFYSAQLKEGSYWQKDLEVVIGTTVAETQSFKVGDTFYSQHGLDETGHSHEESPFTVVGILDNTGTVLDNLILTSVSSIWKVHDSHEDDDHEDSEHHEGYHDDEGNDHTSEESTNEPTLRLLPGVHYSDVDTTTQITSLLIKFRSPMGAVMLPRMINQETSMQAASPAFETARLFSLIGVGVSVAQSFAAIIIFISVISIFIALYNSMKERKYDLAIMRSMGASKSQLFLSVIYEGIIITLLGYILGIVLAHLSVVLINNSVPATEQTGIRPDVFYQEELVVFVISLVVGIISSVIPAINAIRTDISETLSQG